MIKKRTFPRGIPSRIAVWASLFFIILFCNILTDYCVDDFTYFFSLATKERITSFFQIFPSLMAHAEKMNGRLTAHFFTHLFLLLPKIVFDIANTAAFLLQIVFVIKIGQKARKRNIWLPIFVFFLLWLFEPAFGQVNFWLDGACNYLWSSTAALLFLFPFAMHYLRGDVIKKRPLQILFVIFGLPFGNFMENSSATAITLAITLMILSALNEKKMPRMEEISSVIFAFLGYLCMIFAPAEIENKTNLPSLSVLRERLSELLVRLSDFAILFILIAVLFLLSWRQKTDKKIFIFALLMTFGGLFSHFLLLFAPYYPDRCGAFTVVLLTCAATTLAGNLLVTKMRPVIIGVILIILCFGIYHLAVGVQDVYKTSRQMEKNIEILETAAEADITDVTLPIIAPNTRYSAIHGLRYLSDNPNEWPNRDMARYYGVTSIIGSP